MKEQTSGQVLKGLYSPPIINISFHLFAPVVVFRAPGSLMDLYLQLSHGLGCGNE